jgi:protein involved in polysaccharide export with SLBB domain
MAAVTGYFYIAGKAANAGKRNLTSGLTLSGVIASAALAKDGARRVKLRTRSTNGSLIDTEVDIKALRNGKVADVEITQGSIVEFID